LENYRNRQNVEASPRKEFNYFTDAKSINGVQNQMYIDKAPEGILKALNQ
jgi:hypothetical protein